MTVTQSAPSESKRVYFLELDNNMFGLSPDDIGRTITLSINYVTDNGSEQDYRITEEIMLSEPSLSLPSLVNCSVLSKTEDLYNITVVSGISWTNGSCVARRIVEKQSGGSWVEIPDGTEAQIQSFAWYFGDEAALQGSELIFTPQLKELIRAQTTSLQLFTHDFILIAVPVIRAAFKAVIS